MLVFLTFWDLEMRRRQREEERGTALLDPLVVHVSDGTFVLSNNSIVSLDIPCFPKGSGICNF